MQYLRNIIMLISLILFGCNESTQAIKETTSQSSSNKPELVSALCLASTDDNSDIDKLLKQTINRIHIVSNTPQTWVELGNTWIRKSKLSNDPGFYLHAQECANYALTLDMQNIPAQEIQVQVLLNNHEFKAAKKLAQSIITTTPNSRLGWALLSDAQLELGDIEQAEKSIDTLRDLRAGMAFFTRLSYLKWLRGDIKEANAALLAALQRRDVKNAHSTAWSFVQGAKISWYRSDLLGAEALYKEALKWLPNYSLALTGLARIALASKTPKIAIAYLNQIKTGHETAETIWLLADALEMAGEKAASINNYNKIITLARHSDPLLLARFLSTKNMQHSLALELILKEKQKRGGIYIDDVYAWTLYRLGKFEQAQVAIEQALSWGTKDARLFYHAGAIKIAAGNIKDGIALVRKALSLHPAFDFTASKEALGLIHQYGDAGHV